MYNEKMPHLKHNEKIEGPIKDIAKMQQQNISSKYFLGPLETQS